MNVFDKINALPIWSGAPDIEPLTGGITNVNFKVRDSEKTCVVRLGEDIPEHGVMRFNELAASRAAHAAGLAPEVLYADTGLTVLEFLDARTLTPENIRIPEMLDRIIELVGRAHRDIPKFLRGPSLIFWVFHVIRDYGARLSDGNSAWKAELPGLIKTANALEQAAGPFDIVFGHNDLLAGNLMDDGQRLWLIDYDYAGFNSPLFDLGGLASNNELDEAAERRMLEAYFDAPVSDDLLHRYGAMKCASLLRETMWSMVSEITSEIDFDYHAYTIENLARFRAAHSEFMQS